MYPVIRRGKSILESDACGIGLLATRKGVAERSLVATALDLTKRFDHRGAPGHGAGLQLDIPWPLLLDRFSAHAKLIAQRDVALGMFFLPYEAPLRRQCVETVERLASVAGADVLQWADVPVNAGALDPGSSALRTLPIVRQALFRRPAGMSEDGWFACRYLLRLALERGLSAIAGDEFTVVSLSNRTVVYKGLAELSRIGDLYPDLQDPHFASRYVVFHSRYCTNTTTAWRRAQPFWAIAHNGEVSTIKGNVAWMNAIGKDLIRKLAERFPSLTKISAEVDSVVCTGGSDTANLDDMMIALMVGGMSFPQAVLALLPPATSTLPENDPLQGFARAANVYLGACDGPAALVGCDGDHAIAHLDRNGLRPLWVQTSRDYVLAVSELTGTLDLGDVEAQRVMGPGDSVVVELGSGRVFFDEAVRAEVARHPFPSPDTRITEGSQTEFHQKSEDLPVQQRAFGMTREDIDVIIRSLADTGKAALGSMGDDTSPAAMLDELPRRMEDHFALRFAQETSPPIDPIRDAWVFDGTVALGDRSGLWSKATGPLYSFPHRVLGKDEIAWLTQQSAVRTLSLLFPVSDGEAGLELALNRVVDEAVQMAAEPGVLILSDRYPSPDEAALPPIRVISRLHRRLVDAGIRNRVGLVADVGIWDIHHCALLITLGADAVCPWIGYETAADGAKNYVKGLRSGLIEAMSMMGVTPASAYCGASLVEAIGLDPELMRSEFPGVPLHLGGIGKDQLNKEWLGFHHAAFDTESCEQELPDAGEFRHTKGGRRHANNAEVVRSLHLASGYAKKLHAAAPGSQAAYDDFKNLVNSRTPVTILDLLQIKKQDGIPIEEVESEEAILWRFMAPGMSEGALSGPAHQTVARAFNVLYRYCRIKLGGPLPGIGPVANSGEGGFDKARVGTRDGNRSVQYAGGRFTITPSTAARAAEAEVKFAQGAKPGKGGQLPGKKVSARVAHQRGCEPGYELVSPPINHNLYSIEDVKLMIESWRHLNPQVNCALKYVATYGVEMVASGGVNAGANRLHLSDGCGGTGAAKRVDQKHAGVPVVAVLPTVHDMLIEENVRHLVELSVDGGIQTGNQALKLFLLGADRVGFGTSLLISIGCSMLRKCHLSGPDPSDPTGKRRLGCTPGIATQDPTYIARFTGDWRHIVRMLRFVAQEIRQEMANIGAKSISEIVGRRDFLERKEGLVGKSAQLDLTSILSAPHAFAQSRNLGMQSEIHMPTLRHEERAAAERSLNGQTETIIERLTNEARCVGVGAAGIIARKFGDLGLDEGGIRFVHSGAAGHFYGAYSVEGLEFRIQGVVADSAFTAAYGGLLVVSPADGQAGRSLIGNAFGYGARGGRAYIAGHGGNRFGICLRKSHEGKGPRIVVEGVEANAFQYMTGGVALVLGTTGPNLGSGMTGGHVYLLDLMPGMLNSDYVGAFPLGEDDENLVKSMLKEHVEHTDSSVARMLLDKFEAARFSRVSTILKPELVPELATVA